ncbi:MAG: (deoxy)nucleoside triphosphate pyrophosphohydrolase [Lachnospiraceae bacterium]|nr:(deoxy)nucleoside triphosphate pyrophosphohydrolase [Lachnospiraceae bacterium]
MKTIRVAAAIILRNGRLLATQRSYGSFQDGWEFPGGKIEEGETPQQALVREIQEELDAEITVGKEIAVVEYDYPAFHLTMHCYLCTIPSGQLTLKEHKAAAWLTKETLHSVAWLPANITLIQKLSQEWDSLWHKN